MNQKDENDLQTFRMISEKRYDDVPMNEHGVSLERVQRCHHGIDDEDMDFNEATIADMLQDIADSIKVGHPAFVLRGLANALRETDPAHKLVLRQKRPGKWESPTDQTIKTLTRALWTVETHKLVEEGWQMDAAVYQVAADHGVGVSTVYAGMKEFGESQTRIREQIAQLDGSDKATPDNQI